VRPAGFEPASEAWKASILTRLDYGRSHRKSIVSGYDLRVMIEWTKLDRLVISEKAYYHYCSYAYLRSGVIVQTGGFNPFVFFVAFLGLMIGFIAMGYYRSLQKGSPDQTDEPAH
jgi:hypothetical protein